MHSYKILRTAAEWEPFRQASKADWEKLGGQWPQEGQALMFAEVDESGEPVAFQFLQTGIFAEGLWARQKGDAHLTTVWNLLIDWVREQNKAALEAGGEISLLTMTKSDERGNRIGRAVMRRMRFEETDFKVYRRRLCQQ